jgi:hypothetical protein
VALAIAVIGAGGLLSPLPGLAGTAIVVVLLLGVRGSRGSDRGTVPVERKWPARAEPFGLALLLALLVRALAGLVIATPAMLLALPLVLLAITLLPKIASTLGRWVTALVLLGLMIGAGLIGVAIEREGPMAQGMVRSGPLLGVHPRQAIAVSIDGFGPHDVIADDYVEPDGRQGRDPASWAERLEAELHAIAELHYAEGPARAREAFGRAEVEIADPIVPPDERDHYDMLIGVEIRSGTLGEGSRVEFGCPGAVIDPRGDRPASPIADCPRKYARDGSTGLGVSPRWPGYTELRGRDRMRIARVLAWPSGDRVVDRRVLALELGLISLVLLVAMLWLGRRTSVQAGGSELAILGSLALFAVALLRPSGPVAPAETGMLLPLAAALALIGRSREGTGPSPMAWVIVGLMIAPSLSPLAGQAGVLGLGAGLRELLVVDAGVSWEAASVVASAILLLTIAPGTLACARALLRGPEDAPKVTRVPWRAILAVVIASLLILRKPVGDPALLACGTALVLACRLPDDLPVARRWLAMAFLAFAAGFSLLEP